MARGVIAQSDEERGPDETAAIYDHLVAEGKLTRDEADVQLAEGLERLASERARPLDDRARDLLTDAHSNPRIDLDDGGVVWGFQCWWGNAERFEAQIAGRRVVTVPLPEENRQA